MNTNETIRISEIFGPTIQGEGALIGRPTIFVRTGGCDYRCSWCDTLYAVESRYRHDWKPMTAENIMTEIETLSAQRPITISLSGGNPAIQPLETLIDLGHAKGYTFAIETQGSVSQNWFAKLDVLTLSPKPPSSGMDTNLSILDECIEKAGDSPEIALKFVVFDEKDYNYAKAISARYPHLPVYLQPGNHTPPPGDNPDAAAIDIPGIMARMRWLIETANNDGWYTATILPQLHTLIWGNERGV